MAETSIDQRLAAIEAALPTLATKASKPRSRRMRAIAACCTGSGTSLLSGPTT